MKQKYALKNEGVGFVVMVCLKTVHWGAQHCGMFGMAISFLLLVLSNVLAAAYMAADAAEPWYTGTAHYLRHCSDAVEIVLHEYERVGADSNGAGTNGKEVSSCGTSQKKPAYPSDRNAEKSPQKPRPCQEEVPSAGCVLPLKREISPSNAKTDRSGNFVGAMIQKFVHKFTRKADKQRQVQATIKVNAGKGRRDLSLGNASQKGNQKKKRVSSPKKKSSGYHLHGSIDGAIVAKVIQYKEKDIDVPNVINRRIQRMMHYNVPLKPFEATVILPPLPPPLPPRHIDTDPPFVGEAYFANDDAHPMPWLLSLIPTQAIDRVEGLVEEILVHIEDRLGRETAEIVQATIRDTTLKFLNAQETWMQRNEPLSIADFGMLPTLPIPGMLPTLPIPDAIPQGLRILRSPFGFLIATIQNGASLDSSPFTEGALTLSSSCDNISACTPQSLPGSPNLRKKVLGNFHNISDDTLYRARDKLRYQIDESMHMHERCSSATEVPSSSQLETNSMGANGESEQGSRNFGDDAGADFCIDVRADPRLGIFNPQESHADIVHSCGDHCVTKVNGSKFRSVRSALPLRLHPNESDWTFVEVAVDSLNASSMHTINRHAHTAHQVKGNPFSEQRHPLDSTRDIRRSASYEDHSQFNHPTVATLPRRGSFHTIQPCNIALGLSTLDMPLNMLCGSWPDSLAFSSTGYYSQNSSFKQFAFSTADWTPMFCGFSFGDRPALLVKVIPIYGTDSQRSTPGRSPGLSLSRDHSDDSVDLTVDAEDDTFSLNGSLNSSCSSHELVELLVLVKLVVNGQVVPISQNKDRSMEAENALEFR
jgi:hypothetical protein